jgi:Bacterial SH3 domain
MINAIKIFLGVILGIAALGGMIGAGGYYFFMNNLSVSPKRPRFAEEGKPKPKPPAVKKTPAPEEKAAKKKPAEEELKEIPNGAYGATVIWETGVSLRQEATDASSKVGSVAFKEKVTVMQENTEKTWVQVRNSDGTLEGWLKSGNIEKDPGTLTPGN